MGRVLVFALAASFLPAFAWAQNPQQAVNPDTFYQLGPDSLEQKGVPKGEIRGPFVLPSNVYAGTQHTYWVYVPAQYSSAAPASLMIFNEANYAWGMSRHGQAMGGAILPEMMRWLWRDHAVSTDPRDMSERSFHEPTGKN